MLAGNGSRFLEWLQRDWDARSDNPFRAALLQVLARASAPFSRSNRYLDAQVFEHNPGQAIVSVAGDVVANAPAEWPSVSADGALVAFESAAETDAVGGNASRGSRSILWDGGARRDYHVESSDLALVCGPKCCGDDGVRSR